MKKSLKVFLFIIVAILVIVQPTTFAKADTTKVFEQNTINDMESLKEYLDDYSLSTAADNGIENVTEESIEKDVRKVEEQVGNLSKKDQEKFFYYLSNPEAMQVALEDENNKDIVLEEVTTDTPVFTRNLLQAAVSKTRNASYTYSMKLFKIEMTRYVVAVKYTTSGGTVKKIVSSSGYVDKNLNPAVKTSRIEKDTWIANNRAKTTSRFHYSLFSRSQVIQIGTVTLHVEGTSGGARYNAYAKLS
ncbi:hypothetical protein HCJ40_12045 [Listeria sp. FSL L7-0993]|uniref:hypothetical protein n=1 Tax=Listeria cossartiae TaxID=2838249 RepID=UPI0016274C0F|nr:hypothetical protein [Listeria cossartiae]MBC1807748.1 hypothetical protein [Listeria cossartiae subsp. cayugensis]